MSGRAFPTQMLFEQCGGKKKGGGVVRALKGEVKKGGGRGQ